MAHHEFSPTTYYNTMGSHPPAFHVEAGDSISTTTVDARGFDHENVERAGRPNPQTGPFHVNGAEAGDNGVGLFRFADAGTDVIPQQIVVEVP